MDVSKQVLVRLSTEFSVISVLNVKYIFVVLIILRKIKFSLSAYITMPNPCPFG